MGSTPRVCAAGVVVRKEKGVFDCACDSDSDFVDG